MKISRKLASKLCLGLCIAFIACSSPEERAQQHYDRALELMADNETAKARLELQNAVKLNAKLKDAWFQLATILEASQNYNGAAGNFQKVLELDPNHFGSLHRLAKLELNTGQFQKALENINRAISLDTTDSNVHAIRAAVLLRLGDREGSRSDAERALALNPDNPDAHAVLANDKMLDDDLDGALLFVDRGLSTDPENVALLLFRIRVHEQMKQYDKVEETLRQLIQLDKGSRRARQALVKLLKELGRFNDAEVEMRALFDADPSDKVLAKDLIGLINQGRGTKAARNELEKLIAKHANIVDLRLELAKLEYVSRGFETARPILEGIIAKREPAAEVQRARVVLARLLIDEKQRERAAELIEEILTLDQKNTDALALRASLRLDAGDTTNAIADLREALSQDSRSVLLLRLLGRALDKQGSVELAQERFAQAVKLSRFAPAFTLDYVRFLLRRGKLDQAESVLVDALSINSRNVPMLEALGQVRLQKSDWPGAQSVASSLEKITGSNGISNVILGRAQLGQQQYDKGIATFEAIHSANPQAFRPMLTLVKTYMQTGKANKAKNLLQSSLEANPDNAEALVLMGTLKALEKDETAAEAAFRQAIEAQPKINRGYIALAKLYMDQDKIDEAQKILEQSRISLPENLAISLTLASILQKRSDINAAIELYEEIFQALKQNTPPIILNNLASLLSDHRTDQQSLDRAAEIATKLVNTRVPKFRDTIGWIAYQQGRYSEALGHLEYAVEKLPKLALAHYHLGQVYVSLDRNQDAYDQFNRALELTKDTALKKKITDASTVLNFKKVAD